MHVPPAHAVGTDVEVSHVLPHPPQFVIVVIDVSQPSTSVPVVLQFAQPALQPE